MPEEKKGATVPDTLPEGFVSVKPHVNEQAYKYTITLCGNENYYAVTSDAKKPVELFERIFCEPDKPGALPRKTVASKEGVGDLCFYVFPEAVIQFTPDTLESIVAGWPPEDELDEDEEEEEEEDEDDRPRRKPRKPW